MGGREPTYRNCKRMAIDVLVEQNCIEEGVGFIDLSGYFVGKEDMYVRDGLHLSGRTEQYSLRTCFHMSTVKQVATD